MMKTSRIALWILCLALVASCKKNGNTGNDVPENGFRATIEQTKGGGSKGERTHINPDWGNEEETGIYWSAGDHIKVSNQSGNTLTFQLTEGENTMYGTFYTGEQNDGFFEPDYMAAYPAANAEGTATTISGSTATFSMLSTQSYKANTFDEAMGRVHCRLHLFQSSARACERRRQHLDARVQRGCRTQRHHSN